jgi:defect-in-organelle-trafficking protein DotD
MAFAGLKRIKGYLILMIRFSLIFSVTAGLIVLAGCGPINRNFSDSHPQMVAAPDSVSARLAEAADRASLSLEKLAAVEYSRSPNAGIAPAGDAPAELRRAVTVNWVGPVEPIAKTMAERAGYNFLPVGAAPPVPVVVSLDVENRPLIDVLRDIGLQLGVRGDIKVDSSQKVVELHYPPNTGVGVEE